MGRSILGSMRPVVFPDLSSRGYTSEAYERSVRRLRVAAAVAGALNLLVGSLPNLFPNALPAAFSRIPPEMLEMFFRGSLGGFIGSMVFVVVLGRVRVSERVFPVLAVVFQAWVAGSISFRETLAPMVPTDMVRGLAGAALWAVFFPAIVPLSIRPAIVGGALASFAPSIALALMTATGYTNPPSDVPVMYAITGGVTLGLAVTINRVLYNLQRRVDEARQLGSYVLEDKIGEGGMGEVWIARHQALSRPAAVKLIRAERVSEGTIDHAGLHRRFEQEAQVTAVLRSPHTVEVYDYGVADDATFYYAMEFLRGVDLQSLVEKGGPLPASRVITILQQACDSLDEAHTAGLVHRDIKPHNLMLLPAGVGRDLLKVLDFGLVRRQANKRSDLTDAQSVIGTPAYLAPELAMGLDEVDGRTDLYALGCVGWWLLSGTLVFEARTPMELVMKHAAEYPPQLRDMTELPVPEKLHGIIMRCLEKRAEDRFESAAAMAVALEDAATEAGRWTRGEAEVWWQKTHPDLLQAQ